MAEARATAEAASITRILNDAAMDPSTKRFVKGRAGRIERWLQLESVAHTQVSGLQALARVSAPKRAPKVKAPAMANLPETGWQTPPAEAAVNS